MRESMKAAWWKSSVAPIEETTLVVSMISTNWLASAGIDRLDRLEEHDMAEGLAGGEAERAAGLDLAAAYGFEAGAQDLGAIGAHIDRQRDQRRSVGAEPDADRGQAEEDDEELHQQRRVADGLDIDAGGKADRRERADGGDGDDEGRWRGRRPW